MRVLRAMIRHLPTMLMSMLLAAGLPVSAGADDAALSGIPNVQRPEPNRVASGALDATTIESVRRAGIKHVINLRPAHETPDFDEARAAAEQGLSYHSLPIEGSAALTRENVRMLDELLEQIGDDPALIHCASGNRVGALIALREAWIKGQPTEAAIAEGRRWGLTRMEDAVRDRLEQ